MKPKPYCRHLIPLFAAIPFTILSAVMIVAALTYNGSEYHPFFVGHAGTFRFNDIRICGITLYTMLMLIGLAVAIVISVLKRRQYNFGVLGAVLITVFFFLLSYLGAKLLFGIERVIAGRSFASWSMSGQSLFGVLYVSVPLFPLVAKLLKRKPSEIYDYYVFTYLILLSFIRLGCFTSDCCYARVLFFREFPVKLPVQLFEVICDLGILSLCLWLDRPDQNGRPRGRGIFPVLLICYCVTRFLLEFLRYSDVHLLGFSVAQLHCIVFFLIGLGWLCSLWEQDAKSKRRRKRP